MGRYFFRSVSKLKPVFISLFLALNLMIIFTAGLPDKSEFGRLYLRTVRPYMNFVGLEQPWSMFAPNPTTLNAYIEGVIYFKDGSQEIWSMPRPTKMNAWDIILGGDRYCMIAEKYLRADSYSDIWKDVSKYVARGVEALEGRGQGREVDMIQFYRYYNYVARPQKLFVYHGQLNTYSKEPTYYYYPPAKVRYEARHDYQRN